MLLEPTVGCMGIMLWCTSLLSEKFQSKSWEGPLCNLMSEPSQKPVPTVMNLLIEHGPISERLGPTLSPPAPFRVLILLPCSFFSSGLSSGFRLHLVKRPLLLAVVCHLLPCQAVVCSATASSGNSPLFLRLSAHLQTEFEGWAPPDDLEVPW